MVSKVMSDPGCSEDIAVSWAVASKNALANVYGYVHTVPGSETKHCRKCTG